MLAVGAYAYAAARRHYVASDSGKPREDYLAVGELIESADFINVGHYGCLIEKLFSLYEAFSGVCKSAVSVYRPIYLHRKFLCEFENVYKVLAVEVGLALFPIDKFIHTVHDHRHIAGGGVALVEAACSGLELLKRGLDLFEAHFSFFKDSRRGKRC